MMIKRKFTKDHWKVLQKIENILDSTTEGNYIMYLIENAFTKPPKNTESLSVNEGNAIYDLENRRVLNIKTGPESDESNNRMEYKLEILPKFKDVYKEYE